MQSPARRDGCIRVAWLFRSPVLRLQQIDVAATGDVDGVSARAENPPFLADQRQPAAAHRAEQYP